MKALLHIAPLVEPISARFPGGAEQCVFLLSAKQAEKSENVRVIATRKSDLAPEVEFVDLGIDAGLLIPVDTSVGRSTEKSAEKENRIREKERQTFEPARNYLLQHKSEIDLVHNHAFDFYPMFQLNDLGIPIIHTLHLPPLVPWIAAALRDGSPFADHVRYVTVSKATSSDYLSATGFEPAVVYNGTDIDRIAFSPEPGQYYVWVGRISREKGLHTAIDVVVNKLKQPLVVIGRIYDQEYYEEEIAAKIDNPLITFHGYLPHKDVLEIVGRAKALLFPIEWEEPFGLVLIEALATGTPVVAYSRGAVPEIVLHGKNGFLAENRDELVRYLGKVEEISREACRASVMRFGVSTMVEQYEKVYEALLSQ